MRLKAALALCVALGIVASPVASEAQQPGKPARVRVLGLTPLAPELAPVWEAFVRGLRERSWVEGQNIIIDSQFAGGSVERLRELTAELVRTKTGIILALGPPATRAAKDATATIPIVLVGVADPVRLGLVASLARPGGNVTYVESRRSCARRSIRSGSLRCTNTREGSVRTLSIAPPATLLGDWLRVEADPPLRQL